MDLSPFQQFFSHSMMTGGINERLCAMGPCLQLKDFCLQPESSGDCELSRPALKPLST